MACAADIVGAAMPRSLGLKYRSKGQDYVANDNSGLKVAIVFRPDVPGFGFTATEVTESQPSCG